MENKHTPSHIEPIALKANDRRVMVNGRPLTVDFRVISEDEYRILRACYDAVPDLLEALELAIEDIDGSNDLSGLMLSWVIDARNAIAKARGQ